ncbi:MAG: NAD-dependent epimerase/dehydratase family protein [Dehalococcoidia bacterium]
MKVLVTGSDGYIGSNLVPFLSAKGFEVTGLDTRFYGDGCLYGGEAAACDVIVKDIRNVEVRDLEGFEAIVHLAELSNDPLGRHSPEVTNDINYNGTRKLAEKAKEAGIRRFVYSSSCSVYGVGNEEYKSEDSAVSPQTAYARCKVLAERSLQSLADKRFCPTILRNATAFGPSPRMRFDIVLNNLAGQAWTTRDITLVSNGTPWRPLVHVLDICEAITCSLTAPRETVHNQVFNVGENRQNYRIIEIAEIVATAFPDSNLIVGTSGADNRSYRVEFDKIKKALPQFQCKRDPVVGVRELKELFQDICLTRQQFEFRAYTRLSQLEYLLETRRLDSSLFWTVPEEQGGSSGVARVGEEERQRVG